MKVYNGTYNGMLEKFNILIKLIILFEFYDDMFPKIFQLCNKKTFRYMQPY